MSTAPDLTRTAPRPFDAELEGYAYLPRMFDKARAARAATLGTYLFGCPVDHTCMARLGITPDLVLDLVGRYDDDADVLAALRDHGIPPAEEAWFDAPAVEDELAGTGTYLRVRRRDALPERDGGRVFAGADHGADATVILVDDPPGTERAWHRHPVAELVVVHGGEATFFLGERQQRIVRAGEIVRIPAGVPHRHAVTGAEPLRAVAVHGAADVGTEPAD